MTPANAAALANLTALRAAARKGLEAVNAASENGTTADWMAARAACRPLCDAARIEEERIVAAGFGGDTDFEFAVLGRLGRRHTNPVMVTWTDLRAG